MASYPLSSQAPTPVEVELGCDKKLYQPSLQLSSEKQPEVCCETQPRQADTQTLGGKFSYSVSQLTADSCVCRQTNIGLSEVHALQ